MRNRHYIQPNTAPSQLVLVAIQLATGYHHPAAAWRTFPVSLRDAWNLAALAGAFARSDNAAAAARAFLVYQLTEHDRLHPELAPLRVRQAG